MINIFFLWNGYANIATIFSVCRYSRITRDVVTKILIFYFPFENKMKENGVHNVTFPLGNQYEKSSKSTPLCINVLVWRICVILIFAVQKYLGFEQWSTSTILIDS